MVRISTLKVFKASLGLPGSFFELPVGFHINDITYLLSPQIVPRKLQKISGQKSLQYSRSYFGQNDDTKKTFRNLLTFSSQLVHGLIISTSVLVSASACIVLAVNICQKNLGDLSLNHHIQGRRKQIGQGGAVFRKTRGIGRSNNCHFRVSYFLFAHPDFNYFLRH